MSPRLSFSQYLVGHASLDRPPFFYAYAGMWLHLLVGGLVVLLLGKLTTVLSLTSMVVGSFCLGVLVYGTLAREYGLLLNLFSYGASMGRIFYPRELSSVFLLIALLIALVSGYLLLSGEYRRYNQEVFGDRNIQIPAWISITIGTVVVLICVFGLQLF
ncbi:MAG: hypothetical protein WDA75_17005 [Candidatus Latescibacterota bacterium]|jgi:hypothetical protein